MCSRYYGIEVKFLFLKICLSMQKVYVWHSSLKNFLINSVVCIKTIAKFSSFYLRLSPTTNSLESLKLFAICYIVFGQTLNPLQILFIKRIILIAKNTKSCQRQTFIWYKRRRKKWNNYARATLQYFLIVDSSFLFQFEATKPRHTNRNNRYYFI